MAKPEINATVAVQLEASALVRPGDTLVVAVGRDIMPEEMQSFSNALTERLPGVKVLVVNANALAVYRPDDSDA